MDCDSVELRLGRRDQIAGTHDSHPMATTQEIAIETMDEATRRIAGKAGIRGGDYSDVHGSTTRSSRRRLRAHSRHGSARSTTNSTG